MDFARRFPSILFSAGHLLESKSFAIEALRINQKVLPFLNQKLRDNDSVVRAAVATFKTKNRTKLLRFASERLRDNKKFMKEIIQTCPGSFPFLSKRLRKDKDLAKFCIQLNKDIKFYTRTENKIKRENQKREHLINDGKRRIG